jgi:hypothetical protein
VTAWAATDLLGPTCGPDVFRLLVIEQCWNQPQFEDLLAGMPERTLFA